MIKNKRGAEHVDWAISIGIFLLFLLTILVYIKPVYKPTYEAETLGEMVKNSFLAENNRTIYRTLVITVYKDQPIGCEYIKVDFNNLGEKIYVMNENLLAQTQKYQKKDNSVLFPNSNSKYWVYHNLEVNEGDNDNGDNNYKLPCTSDPKKGEVSEYTGLKSITSVTSFGTPIGFPDSKQFNVKIRNANSGKVEGYQGIDPPEDVSVYVYEFVYPSLTWVNNQPEKTNYIVSIQIW